MNHLLHLVELLYVYFVKFIFLSIFQGIFKSKDDETNFIFNSDGCW